MNERASPPPWYVIVVALIFLSIRVVFLFQERKTLRNRLKDANLEMLEWHRRALAAEDHVSNINDKRQEELVVQQNTLSAAMQEKERDQAVIQRLRERGKESDRQRDEAQRRAIEAETRASRLEAEALGASRDESDQALIKRLRERGKDAVRQSQEWENRALAAEAKILQYGDRRPTDTRFEELRRYLAREFHPDHVVGDGLEKMFRAEVFKKIWPKIEEISGGR